MSTSREGSEGRRTDGSGSGEREDPGVSPPTVLIADGRTRAERFREWLPDTFPVRIATSLSDAREQATQAVGIAIIGAGVSQEAKRELLEVVTVRSAFVRTIVVQAGDEPPMLGDPGYDDCLYQPVDREHLTEAVRQLARIATYERAIATFFEYTTHAANMKVGRDPESLADDDTYKRVQRSIERTQATLDRIQESLTEADREVLMESIDGPTGPVGLGEDETGSSGSKRRPDGCRECGIEWGVRHGGDVGEGYEQLGAFVWKCTNCGAVQQSTDPSHRRLARR